MCFEYSRCAIGVRGMYVVCTGCVNGVCVVCNGAVRCDFQWRCNLRNLAVHGVCNSYASGVRARHWCATACEKSACFKRGSRLVCRASSKRRASGVLWDFAGRSIGFRGTREACASGV
jgi:hypothetical protein